jgi:hypothetical protein
MLVAGHQLSGQGGDKVGSGRNRLLCICRPPTALLHATARCSGAASSEMGGGASGGLRLILTTRRDELAWRMGRRLVEQK